MEFKIIFWIVVGLIWLVGNLWKKKEDTHKQSTTPVNPPLQGQSVKKMTKAPLSASKRPSVNKQASVYNDNSKTFGQKLASKKLGNSLTAKLSNPSVKNDQKYEKGYDSYIPEEEDAIIKKTAADREASRRMKIRTEINQEERKAFDPYAVQTNVPARIFKLMQDPENLRDSILIAEILKPKF